MYVDDFNEVLFNHEKKGGQVAKFTFMQMFHSTLSSCNLQDVGFVTYKYTWTNGQKRNANMQDGLNRYLVLDIEDNLF